MHNQQPDLLLGLSPADADAVMAIGTSVTLSAGDVLFELGDDADAMYVVRQGRVALTLPIQIAGHEADVFVEERLPGQAIGWSALTPPYRFTFKATSPLATEVTRLPRRALFEFFGTRPEVGYAVGLNLAAVIGQRLQVVQTMWLREMQRMVDAHA